MGSECLQTSRIFCPLHTVQRKRLLTLPPGSGRRSFLVLLHVLSVSPPATPYAWRPRYDVATAAPATSSGDVVDQLVYDGALSKSEFRGENETNRSPFTIFYPFPSK